MLFTCSLKKNNQFKVVYNKGKSIADKLLVMYVYPNRTEGNRLGLSVSKKVGKSVIRNRIRRLIKESYRAVEKEGVRAGYDIVVIARQSSSEAVYCEIRQSVSKLLYKHGLTEIYEKTGESLPYKLNRE